MIYDSIHIKNYKGLREFELKNLSHVNLLFGLNNCGKSSVLEAIFLLSGQSDPLRPVNINQMRNIRGINEQNLLLNFYGANADNRIEISSKGVYSRKLRVEMSQREMMNLNLKKEGQDNVVTSVEGQFGLELSYQLGDDVIEYKSRMAIESDEKGVIGIDKRYKEQLYAEYIPSIVFDFYFLPLFEKVVQEKREQEVLQFLRIVEPNIQDIQMVGDKILMDVGLPNRLPINVMGDGVRKALAVILNVINCKSGVLLLDEFGNGLHPKVMPAFWHSIIEATRTNDVQLFIATHSIDLLKALCETENNMYASHLPISLCGYKMIKKDDGSLKSVRYDDTQILYMLEQEIEMR